jgi:hypothetical protein
MKTSRVLLLSVLFVVACKSGAEVKPANSHVTNPAEDAVRICDIREHSEKFVGSIVSIRARYKSDHMYYAYLLDEGCPSNQTIEVDHPIHTHGDDSVRRFFSMEDEHCAKEGGSVCPIDIEVTVDALIRKQSDGRKIIAEFKSVKSFEAP